MGVIGLLILGAILGSAGVEILRAKNPKLIEKIEDRAKRVVDALGFAKADDKEKESK